MDKVEQKRVLTRIKDVRAKRLSHAVLIANSATGVKPEAAA
jgi:hypothetical protein